MTLNQVGELILKQAEEKGWGHTKKSLDVSEKMILIGTEIAEMHSVLEGKCVEDKNMSLAFECADILLRTLHLGLVWGVNFDTKVEFVSHFSDRQKEKGLMESDYTYLYSMVFRGYEAYRHREIPLFKEFLYKIAYEAVEIANYMGLDIEKAALSKIELNKSRVWTSDRLNGGYQK